METFLFHGNSLEAILLAASFLLVASVLASKISGFLGLPALLLFLGVGMLAGSDGPGGIAFTNYSLTFAVGSVTLALILFDGGFRTSWSQVRPVLGVGLSLSTIGVAVTALATALFCHFAIKMDWLASLIFGAVVSSTDAAAVFGILRTQNMALRGRVQQLLEFEAGSNDPTSVLLTIGILAYASAPEAGPLSLLLLFVKQLGLGFAFGCLGGWLSRWLINHVRLEFEGLYNVLMIGLVILTFSLTTWIGGSGFLAVYVAGMILGSSELLHRRSLLQFYDGIAWISQIALFLVLGLLVFPSHLSAVWKEGVLISIFLALVARPLSVFAAAPVSSFTIRERGFISWVGLRGAAPIVLATLPWSTGYAEAEYIFNLTFFVVLLSVLFQGTSIPWAARLTKVIEPLPPSETENARIGVLPPGFISIELIVEADAPAVGKKIVELGLPSGALFTSIKRSGRFLVPRGETTIEVSDSIAGLARESNLGELSAIFGKQSLRVQEA